MILRSHPKNWEHRPVQQALELFGQANGRDGLVERVKRPSKKSWLLAGGDDGTTFLDPLVAPVLIDAIRNPQRTQCPPPGIRVEACIDAVQDGPIGVRVTPVPRVKRSGGLTPS
jgi:hypothetical protein